MNILHIASGTEGGAKRAANRLIQAQLLDGNQVTLASQSSPLIKAGSLPHELNFLPIKSGIKGKALTLFQKANTKAKYGIMTTMSASRVDLDEIARLKPEIIHIHNWFNIINFDDVDSLLSISPIVFTLHDQRLLTGGCHYAHNCLNFMHDCKACPATRAFQHPVTMNKQKIAKTLGSDSRIGLIAPSRWIFDQIPESIPDFQGLRARKISNILDAASYTESEYVTGSIGILRIAFVAAEPTNPVKGLKQLVLALESISASANKKNIKIELHVFGNSRGVGKSDLIEIHARGAMQTKRIIESLKGFNLAVVPSLEDNSPSVVGEFQLRHIFTIGSNVGGIRERIRHLETGLICNVDSSSIAKAVIQYLELSESSRKSIVTAAYNDAKINYDMKSILSEHYEIYKELARMHL